MTGRKTKTTNISSTIDLKLINTYFHSINSDAYYTTPERVVIPEDTRLPMIEAHVVEKFLMKQKRTAPGPHDIPYWTWMDYAPYLAPMVTKIVNLSLNQQHVPLIWKLANVTPIPKESSLVDCSQLRPISLTNIIIRIVERIIFKQEISLQAKMLIDKDQHAYKEGTSTMTALITCQHHWLKWLDEDVDFVRIISFDLSKAFDSVPHDIICEKLKATNLNPYVINWIIDFLIDRKQRVVVDGLETEYVDLTRGVPKGTVLGPFLFFLMVNDIKSADGDNNLLVKFADDIAVSAPVKNGKDTALTEVTNIKDWANENRMIVNISKTWEMVLSKGVLKQLPPQIDGIKRKDWLKLLGVSFQDDPCGWDLHIDNVLSKASGRIYILRVCKSHGYNLDHLTKLFESLILSLFTYAIEVWGPALLKKHLNGIDKFLARAYRYRYTDTKYNVSSIIEQKSKVLFSKISNDKGHVLYKLLPEEGKNFTKT